MHYYTYGGRAYRAGPGDPTRRGMTRCAVRRDVMRLGIVAIITACEGSSWHIT